MPKAQAPEPNFGLVLTGPKRNDKQMFGGPLELVPTGSKIWKTGKVLNQGGESACVGFSWTQFLMSDPSPFQGGDFDFAMQVYRDAQQIDEWEGEEPEYYGTSVDAGHEVLVRRHLIKPDLYWAKSVSQIMKHVLGIGPVVMGTQWLSGMMEPDENGYVRATGLLEGGHCYVVYGGFNEQNRKEFWCINSWGEDWGLGGAFKMTFSAMRNLLYLQGYGISAMEEAAPR